MATPRPPTESLVSTSSPDGSGTPYRVRIRPPSFAIVGGLGKLITGQMVPDIIPTFGSMNMIGGECDH